MSLAVIYSIWFGYIARKGILLSQIVSACLRGGYKTGRGETATCICYCIEYKCHPLHRLIHAEPLPSTQTHTISMVCVQIADLTKKWAGNCCSSHSYSTVFFLDLVVIVSNMIHSWRWGHNLTQGVAGHCLVAIR
jgi:hypothetical protein